MGRLVKFSVRPSEKWASIEAFFVCNPSAVNQLLAVITERNSTLNFETLKIGTVLEIVTGREAKELRERYGRGTVKDWCMMLNSVHDGLERFAAFLENTVPPMTIAQRTMLEGRKPQNIEEAILWTLKECYTLNGLEAAQNLTVYEYCVARKEKYNEAVVAYNQMVACDLSASRR